ncbi:apolipoprotein D-like [Culex quinquefasciatus]|nr:apolipoprotein D-like [Culex quinquefasciatus]
MAIARHLTLVPLLLAAFTQIANAQIVALGACPKVPQVADFNPQRYGGLWYEQEKYPFIFELGGKCVTAEYSLSADNTITVVNRQISTITGNEQKIFGSARRVGPSKLLVKFPMTFNIEAPYEVLDTDYSNYAVVYSCNNLGLVHTKVVWILTRDRFPSLDIMLKGYYAMDRAKLNRALLTRTDQSNCDDGKVIHVSVPVKVMRH